MAFKTDVGKMLDFGVHAVKVTGVAELNNVFEDFRVITAQNGENTVSNKDVLLISVLRNPAKISGTLELEESMEEKDIEVANINTPTTNRTGTHIYKGTFSNAEVENESYTVIYEISRR